MKGCVPQFEKWLQENLTVVAGIFIGIALLQVRSDAKFFTFKSPVFSFLSTHLLLKTVLSQIFGICLAQNLVSDIEAVRESW